jgi:hypothetical protein
MLFTHFQVLVLSDRNFNGCLTIGIALQRAFASASTGVTPRHFFVINHFAGGLLLVLRSGYIPKQLVLRRLLLCLRSADERHQYRKP